MGQGCAALKIGHGVGINSRHEGIPVADSKPGNHKFNLGCDMILDRIVSKKKEEIETRKRENPPAKLMRALEELPPCRDFRSSLADGSCAIIAEVKRSSPSRGRLVDDFRPVTTALIYEQSGAAAVSVLTEKIFFEGDGRFLTEVKQAVEIPVLRKDFIIDPYQIYETRVLKADALLLIAGLLDEDRLRDFIGLAAGLDLAALVEVHDRGELEKTLAAGAEIIGINNRDLQTFSVDLRTTLDLLPLIPKDKIVVSESGIQTRADIERLMRAGVRAFLIGEALMRSGNIAEKMRELTADD